MRQFDVNIETDDIVATENPALSVTGSSSGVRVIDSALSRTHAQSNVPRRSERVSAHTEADAAKFVSERARHEVSRSGEYVSVSGQFAVLYRGNVVEHARPEASICEKQPPAMFSESVSKAHGSRSGAIGDNVISGVVGAMAGVANNDFAAVDSAAASVGGAASAVTKVISGVTENVGGMGVHDSRARPDEPQACAVVNEWPNVPSAATHAEVDRLSQAYHS